MFLDGHDPVIVRRSQTGFDVLFERIRAREHRRIVEAFPDQHESDW
jgi:hypothetical protein